MQDKAIIKVKVVERGGKVVYGTAYRINQTHAITALHVVENYKSITFIFNDDNETPNFTTAYKKKDYDIALITFPKTTLPEIRTTEINKAEVHNDWHGAGYPRYAEEGSCRQREELKGSCYHCPEGENFFDIDCDRQPTLKEWGGVSGAPVFVENKLVAVISRFDNAQENTHFAASAIWKLLTDDEFRKFFRDKNKSGKILKAVQAYLEDADNTDLYVDLKKAMGGRATASDIVSDLAVKELPEMLETLNRLHTDTEKRTVFIMKLLPWYFIDQAVIIDEAVIGLLENAIDIDCVSDVAAECSVAAFGGREAHIDCIAGGTPYDSTLYVPKDKYALSPETGIGNEAADIDALTHQILAGAALDETLTKRFASRAISPKPRVNRILEEAQKDGKHFYLVVRLDSTRSDYKEKSARLRKYKEKYPALLILNLSSSEEIDRQEDVLYVKLPALIS